MITSIRKNKTFNKKLHKKNKEIILDPIILIDLLIAGIESGTPITKTLLTIGDISKNKQLQSIAKKILLGLSWKQSYNNTSLIQNNEYAQILQLLEEKWEKGQSPIPNLKRLQKTIKNNRLQDLQSNVAKLSTQLTLPLGTCYLPSFILLGLIPIIISSGGILFWNHK